MSTLHDIMERQNEEIVYLKKINKIMREALGFYACEDIWFGDEDGGGNYTPGLTERDDPWNTAKEALEKCNLVKTDTK